MSQQEQVEMPYKDLEKKKAYMNEWAAKNREKMRAYNKKYREANRERINAANKDWRKNNREKQRACTREWCNANKFLAIKHYTKGTMACACCGETRYRTLTFDHINNDGADHRREMKNTFIPRWLIKNNFPADFQVLCMNCNFTKGKYGFCDCRDPIPTPKEGDFD